MATADKYAEWIVNNAGKKGTPQFETVRQAYMEAKAEESAALSKQPVARAQSPKVEDLGFGQGMLGLGETALAVGTGALATPFAGLAGLAAMPFVGAEGSTGIIDSIQSAATYEPRTEAGKQIMGGIAKPLQALASGQQSLGNYVTDATGSPALGTAAQVAPDVVASLFGLQAFKKLKGGTPLKNNNVPTRELMDALNEHNIIYSELSPAAQMAIPDVAPRTMIGTSGTSRAVEGGLVTEIEGGGRQRGLAQYSATANKNLTADALAQEAIKQQFLDGDVQMIKTSTPATQAKMLQMIRDRESIAANSANDIAMRPSNIVGDAAAERLKFIAQRSNTARQELNKIAQTNLKGKPFDSAPIEQVFMSKLSELDIGFEMVDGKPKFEFNGSAIQVDRSAQRVLKDLASLMSNESKGAPDALRAHNLKRQIDTLVEYHKNPQRGLTSSGQAVLKDVRRALNESLRASDPSYARVNDTISQSLQLFDQLDDATASKITVRKTLDDSRGMGTELRKLFSNYQSRQDLDVALKAMDELAKKFASTSESRELGAYGGGPMSMTSPSFNDSIVDLARFANVLDDKFGTVAKTSFEGAGERAVKFGMRAAQGGVTQAAAAGLAEKASGAFNKMRKIDDYNAYRSMEELLKRGAK
tara:strand:+ start:1759 stop:3693 length:1935 start_codon:yes stop_codon:yes gene_type:complete